MKRLIALTTASLLMSAGCTGPQEDPVDEGDHEACTLFQIQFHKTMDQVTVVAEMPRGANRDREANELNGMFWESKETARFAHPRATDPLLQDGLIAYYEDAEAAPYSNQATESGFWVDQYCKDITGEAYSLD